MVKRPHIIIFNPDQWRGDVLGHVGNSAAVTPNLDRWVEDDAVSFRNAFCQNPVCTPSRCSFMTGWYPHVRGHRTMYYMLRGGEPVLLKRLKDEGYFVWWGGKNDLVPGQHGFTDYCDVKYRPEKEPLPIWGIDAKQSYRGPLNGDTYYSFFVGKIKTGEADECYYDRDWSNIHGAIDFIHHAPAGRSLCIYLPLTYPHPPYAVEDPWFSMIDRAALPPRVPAPADWSGYPSILRGISERQHMQTWSEERWDELRATYYGMCARVDYQFGLLLKALREAELYDDSAIFFFSDHGDYTGDYGIVEKTQNTFHDCLTKVPFLVKPPVSVPVRPRVSDALVELVDFSATVEALAGLRPTHSHFGRSLLPLLAAETNVHRDAVFCEGGRRHGETQCMELQSVGSQSTTGLYWPRLSVQREEGAAHTKAVMCRTRDHKYVRRLDESDELYDLRSDPQEQCNRIADPALAGILAQLKDRMLTFFLDTGDVVPLDSDQRN